MVILLKTIGTSTVLDLADAPRLRKTPLDYEQSLLVLGYETGHPFLSDLCDLPHSSLNTLALSGRIGIFLS
jgi:hypothetical protein